MAGEKHAFKIQNASAIDTTPEWRGARALDFIAHYLDRIDTHLERIADALTSDAPNAVNVLTELRQIRNAVRRD